jgi:hypothetical protein
MTTHPVPVATGTWQSSDLPPVSPTDSKAQLRAAARRLNVEHSPEARQAREQAAAFPAGAFVPQPELPRREPGVAGARVDLVAAIHRLATFVEESSDIPAQFVSCHAYVDDVLALEAIAERLGTGIYGPDSRPQLAHTLYQAGDAMVQLLVAVKQPDRPL